MPINAFDPLGSLLEDLYNFLLDPESEMAKQKVKYEMAG